AEVTRSIEYIRATNSIVLELDRAARTGFTGHKGSTVHHALERREPLGKVLCVAPFNYPVNELLTTLVPALLMGNVVIAKTPRFGVLANLAMAKVFAECFPAGVISMLPGDGKAVIPPIMQAAYSSTEEGKPGQLLGMIDMLAFIGSEGAAHAIMRHHPSPVSLHKVLGLGSKNAAILLPGADCARAAAALVKGALGFNGQRCTAEKLIFVHRSQADRFVDAFTAGVEALRVGMPWDPDVAITPLPEDGKIDWMRGYIDEALTQGAHVTNAGGGDACGALMRPAVLFPVAPGMRIFHEEQFGPIVPIASYDDPAEVIRWQQSSPYGQQVGIWGPPEALPPMVQAFRRQVSRVNLDDVCQRGPDSFGFTATDKSGFGILSLRDALLTFSRPVLVQSTNRALLG
ncbi:MAG TPA: aldehyde dehydrogenase family protein, partial [Kofleriaceae bacterium]|nr:aldehyde dehydrogenase family protein [Kofleriaceae bacterium]